MRILLVHGWHPVEGGTEAYFGWIRKALADAGHEVKLLTSTAGSAAGGTADVAVRGSTRPAAQTVLQLVNPWAWAGARRTVRTFRPDVALVGVFANFLSPAVLRALHDVPTVLTVTDYKVVCPTATKLLPDGRLCTEPHGAVCLREGCTGPLRWARDRPRYALIERAVRGVDRVLALSDWLRDTLARNGVGSETLTWPVADPARGVRRRPTEAPSFLYVGRLTAEKGVAELVRAFERVRSVVPGATLTVAGSGPLAPLVAAAAANADGGLRLLGWTGPERLEEEYARAWAVAAPSVWAEPLGLVAIESIVRGVPVVASRTGGFAETVAEGAGILVPNGDVDALTSALLDVAAGRAFPDRRVPEPLRRAAADRHDLGAHVARLRTVLGEVADG